MKTIKEILGNHPNNGSIFSKWLDCEIDNSRDNPHRKLREISFNDEIISQIAEWIKQHHISEKQTKLTEQKKGILKKYGLDEFVNSQNFFPDNDNTKKGNLGEIILCEYIEATSDYETLVYKLRYNPNVSQSMKGDDIVLFNKDNLREAIILGEAKYRIPATKSTVNEILTSFGGEPKLPLSLTFISNILRDNGDDDIADEIEMIQIELRRDNIPTLNIGFIIGDINTYKCVDNHHLLGNFVVTQNTIDELKKEDDFPSDELPPLINRTFKTETALHEIINKNLKKKNLPLLSLKNKEKLFEFTQKKNNPNLAFITLSSANADKLLDSYIKAEELLKQEFENELKKS